MFCKTATFTQPGPLICTIQRPPAARDVTCEVPSFDRFRFAEMRASGRGVHSKRAAHVPTPGGWLPGQNSHSTPAPTLLRCQFPVAFSSARSVGTQVWPAHRSREHVKLRIAASGATIVPAWFGDHPPVAHLYWAQGTAVSGVDVHVPHHCSLSPHDPAPGAWPCMCQVGRCLFIHPAEIPVRRLWSWWRRPPARPRRVAVIPSPGTRVGVRSGRR